MYPSNNRFKIVCVVLAALVIVLLIAVAYLLGRQNGKKQEAQESVASTAAATQTEGTEAAVTQAVTAAITEATKTAVPAADAPRNLEIEMAAGNLDIVTGDVFHVEYDASVVRVGTEGDVMTIETTPRHPTAGERRKMKVTVTVPEAYAFADVDIEMGAGKLTAQTLRAETLELELGAGSATLNNLFVSSAAKIEEGAGELAIKGGEVSNLTLESGAGAASIAAKLIGASRIDAAAGAVDLNLAGTQSDYTVTFGVGLGACYYNNEKLARSGSFGTGQNRVTINGGFGVMRVNVG